MTATVDGRPLRICILTASHLGSNPRVVKEAQALHEAGFETMVIAVRTLDSVEPRDQSIMRQARWSLQRIDFRARSKWRLRRLVQMLAQRLWAWLPSIRLNAYALSAFTPSLTAAALRVRADLYIAHYPAALPAAAAAARRHGARYAFDAEDFHPGDWPEGPAYDQDRNLLMSSEARLLPKASYITAASPGIADAYADLYGVPRPTVVLNAFPLAQAPDGPTPRGSAEPGPSVYWFSQVIGPDRGLECAVRALGLAKTQPQIYLRGNARSDFIDKLMCIAREENVENRVHLLPTAIPEEMERLASKYDIGLIAETAGTQNRDIALTNKLFTYMLAGVPAVMSDISAHRRFANETGAAELLFPIDDAHGLAEIFDRLLGDPAKLAAAREAAYELGQLRYNWETERQTLLVAVTASLGLPAAAQGLRL